MEGLTPLDGWTIAAILAKTAGYATALLAMGGPLFVVAFQNAPKDVMHLARRIAIIAALLCLAILALRFGIRAARISGMGVAGALDGLMLSLVWDSPLGTTALWRAAGVLLIPAILIKGKLGLALSATGAFLIAISYTKIGHALGEPRWLLSLLLGLHLLTAAFWVAALAPLSRASYYESSPALLHRFGRIASGTVPLLAIAGISFAALMLGSISGLFTTAYGLVLIAKIAFVSGLLALAAFNKLRLVPAFAAGDARAAKRLRLTIRLEVIAIGFILLMTSTLTSVTTPPVNL